MLYSQTVRFDTL